jgi:predicted metal-binding membrane protein
MIATPLEAVLQRDRIVVASALAGLVIVSWIYVIWLASEMDMGAADMGMMSASFMPWSISDFLIMFIMWAVMMVGMMTPSAAPMILIYARVGRRAVEQGKPFASTGWFASGYLLTWTGFSLFATLTQWALERAALVTPMMTSASPIFGGLILIIAGIYQWSPLKEACLSFCQTPIVFIQRHGGFRRDARGALELGVKHGAYCVGCCWVLMALLFVGGVMNVLWIAGLTFFVLAEKLLPGGRILSRATGVVLACFGIWMLI